MKMYDSYFPHEAAASSNNKIVFLIEELGMKGYGAYWVLLEHLRLQKDYRCSMKALTFLARRMKSTKTFVLRVIQEFDLFVVDGDEFYSPGMQSRLIPLDEKRKEISEKKRLAAQARWKKQPETAHQPDGSLPVPAENVGNGTTGGCNQPSNLFAATGVTVSMTSGGVVSFWTNLKLPEYAHNKETHNFEGLRYQLERMRIEDPTQLESILKLTDYGRKGNPYWRLTSMRPLETWRALKNPGVAILRALKKYITESKDNKR